MPRNPLLSEEDIERGNKKRKIFELRGEYMKERCYNIRKCSIVSGGSFSDQILRSKIMSRQTFHKKHLCLLILYLRKKKNGSLFGYVHCNLLVPDELKATLSNLPPIFKTIGVCRNNIGEAMKNYEYKHRKCFNNFVQSVVDA